MAAAERDPILAAHARHAAALEADRTAAALAERLAPKGGLVTKAEALRIAAALAPKATPEGRPSLSPCANGAWRAPALGEGEPEDCTLRACRWPWCVVETAALEVLREHYVGEEHAQARARARLSDYLGDGDHDAPK